MTAADLSADLNFASLIRRLLLLIGDEQRLLVDVVEAFLKVKVAHRVLLQIPHVQVGIGYVVCLQHSDRHLVAIAADAQIFDAVKAGQLLLQIY